ncbi:HEAT repeat protein-like protein [Lophiostoma macrostomum CBS 122681]|uniref:HEAT repeat protein-like protein n=1 Tax=Lophiostoma macrostomum CBS 122681 TaxID=1314788 RepID=A0A6A6SRE0_9PLEO|nr:HEAT repeat protein-like protein [Lophiostoma macrostomum CBS 122681]
MDRKHIFQRLKTSCVALIEVIATLPQRPKAKQETVQSLANLLQTLQDITTRPDALDAKLAEFVFVPISHVLRVSRNVPVRALELSLECISILLKTGWRENISPELLGQLLILFTFLANPSSSGNGIAATSEELQTLAFKCMSELISQSADGPRGKGSLTQTANIPTLGNAVLVMVDSLADAQSNDVKLHALAAIQSITAAIDDREALASFLPRIVSSLTKVLTPSSSNRPSFRLLERALQTISQLLLRVLSDKETRDLPEGEAQDESQSSGRLNRTTSWLQATASQIQIALANILKLRNHGKIEVRHALLNLCLSVLQDCRVSLADCTGMIVESLVTLAGRDGTKVAVEAELQILLASDTRLADLLRESLYGWVISLPRAMHSKDDSSRRQLIHQITVTIRLLSEEQFDISSVDDLLVANLRDGVSNIFGGFKGIGSVIESTTNTESQSELVLHTADVTSFPPLTLPPKGQDDTMTEFKFLIHQLSKSKSARTVAQDLINTIGSGNEEMQLATFWLSVTLLKDMIQHSSVVDDFLDFGASNVHDELLDELYSLSLARLTKSDAEVETHWHFQALSLEVVALQAQRHKTEFRVELIEALYPVLHHLGSSNPVVRNHAVACLNIVADSCGYTSATELVISNVDYIVNAVGLKLNYHDISPQAPQVLLMMMRLCGAPLLPYLDDLVDSMFSALERYHGYPKLVRLLFSVLQGMVEEGVKAPQLMIDNGTRPPQEGASPNATTISDVVILIKNLKQDASKKDKDHEEFIESFPRRPWKEDDTEHNGDDSSSSKPDSPPNDDTPPAPSDPPPPAPRTFSILLKISELTQHYLTSSSPNLRTLLLSLLNTTIPALSLHENSFLPLINTLWPVLVPRLEDPEAYIVSNTLDIVALMCTHAGGFMKSRIEAIWGVLVALNKRVSVGVANARSPKTSLITGSTSLQLLPPSTSTSASNTLTASLTLLGSNPNPSSISSPSPSSSTSLNAYRPELYTRTPTLMIRTSLTNLFSAIARHVPIQDELFDQMLELLDPVLGAGVGGEDGKWRDVREALESRSADAVWLRLFRKGWGGETEVGAGVDGVRGLKVPRVPEGKAWVFAAVGA